MVGCKRLIAHLSDYIEDDISTSLRWRMKLHLMICRRCSAILASLRKVIALSRDRCLIQAPPENSSRLHEALDKFFADLAEK